MTRRHPDLPGSVPLLPDEEQVRMRALVNRLSYEEMPLSRDDLRRLQHFVKVVRFEVVETDAVGPLNATLPDGTVVEVSPGVGGRAERVNYYMLSERGLKLKFQWERGLLDKHLP
jgi:hypothetical protein